MRGAAAAGACRRTSPSERRVAAGDRVALAFAASSRKSAWVDSRPRCGSSSTPARESGRAPRSCTAGGQQDVARCRPRAAAPRPAASAARPASARSPSPRPPARSSPRRRRAPTAGGSASSKAFSRAPTAASTSAAAASARSRAVGRRRSWRARGGRRRRLELAAVRRDARRRSAAGRATAGRAARVGSALRPRLQVAAQLDADDQRHPLLLGAPVRRRGRAPPARAGCATARRRTPPCRAARAGRRGAC